MISIVFIFQERRKSLSTLHQNIAITVQTVATEEDQELGLLALPLSYMDYVQKQTEVMILLNKNFSEGVQRLKAVPYAGSPTPPCGASHTPRYRLYGLMKQALDGNCEYFLRVIKLCYMSQCDFLFSS